MSSPLTQNLPLYIKTERKKTWSPFKELNGPYLSLFPEDVLCQVWLKLAHWLWRTFSLFRYHPPWKIAWIFIWTNLKPLCQRMLCAKFSWYWPRGSWEKGEKFSDKRMDRRTTGDQKSSFRLSADELKKNPIILMHEKVMYNLALFIWFANTRKIEFIFSGTCTTTCNQPVKILKILLMPWVMKNKINK